jgi:aspartate-semialdehyde dehydrogenase
MKKIYLFGATGNVGRAILSQLLSKKIVTPEALTLFASPASKGKTIAIGESTFVLQSPEECGFEGSPLCIFATDSSVSRTYVPKALSKNCLVIDSSSAFRMQEEVPLIVVPVNGGLIQNNQSNLYSCPNCIASPISLVAAPLEKLYGIKRIHAVTYQSTSGAGKAPMDELAAETKAHLAKSTYQREHFPRQIAFNVIPQIDKVREDGFTGEEHKIIEEVKKIVNGSFTVTATSVRVPVMVGHSVALSIELKREFILHELIELLRQSPFVAISSNDYATPAEIVGTDHVHVGRIRRDPTIPFGLHLWHCSDNLRRGAATDAVELATSLLSK